ncbi:long-chain fatty acid--CoA ligase [Taibaiella sp. KBW10]|uniref:AMP-dependent synthetase/ligase n=1 Tax=Taibaiella sp. KBW10 TaxID=2153357 RepID=UPI000F5A0441|nr:long-chain fatty acid--CoA ligase [Taibaiella sp. KBW10]RQO29810.1 long-chain fatty acid--CoA ligase [Taibaiella sp. KBW10]
MTQYTRLFDCIEPERIGNKEVLLAGKKNKQYEPLSGPAVIEEVNALANGLIHLGLQHNPTTETREKVGIVSNSRPEWIITDLAVQKTGAILVPLYPNTNLDEIAYVFNEAGVKYCFVHDKATYKKLCSIKDQVPSLEYIYTFLEVEDAPNWASLKRSPDAEAQKVIDQRSEAITEDDVATIIYTSGTTGKPKGVMLTHKNIMSNVRTTEEVINGIGVEEKKSLSFLPLNHIFEKTVTYIYLFNQYSIYYAESMETIAENLKEVQPSLFVTVPRLLEKVYEKIMNTGSTLTGVKRNLFYWAVGLGNQYDPQKRSALYNMKLAVANKIIFNKWRAALGGKVKAIVVGGAACPPRIARLFSAAQLTIMEGYGLTESSPVIAVNRYEAENRVLGTVGPAIKGVALKIAEDGEILCKGDNVMLGYYKNPEETKNAIVDGWLHTGDIGTLIEGKFLKITDRKKELFKNSGGKYIAPQPIENKLKESRYIEQIMVLGANEKYVGALIVPNFANMQKWMLLNGLEYTSDAEAVKNEAVIKHYKSVVEKHNKDFSAIEQVKRFVLLDKEWSVEEGTMTPKLSLKRKIITEKYQTQIDEIYRR